jgi:hypothetical protein
MPFPFFSLIPIRIHLSNPFPFPLSNLNFPSIFLSPIPILLINLFSHPALQSLFPSFSLIPFPILLSNSSPFFSVAIPVHLSNPFPFHLSKPVFLSIISIPFSFFSITIALGKGVKTTAKIVFSRLLLDKFISRGSNQIWQKLAASEMFKLH